MKALVRREYGGPAALELEEVEQPTLQANELLIKVVASSINSYDWRKLTGQPILVKLQRGLFKPKNPILGCDVAGVVEQVGKDVQRFQAGDEVYGCLADGHGDSSYAEYVCGDEAIFALKPSEISFAAAAAVPMAAVTALQGLRNVGCIHSGQKILINGASGGVGTFAVQLAKFFGAEVTAVCSQKKLELVHSLGADYLIDYTQTDFTKQQKKYDLILDIAANHSFSEYKPVLNGKGLVVMVGFSTLRHMIRVAVDIFLSKNKDKKIRLLMADNTKAEDLLFMNGLLKSKQLKPVIDGSYSLEAGNEAFRYFEEKHAKGKVIITIN